MIGRALGGVTGAETGAEIRRLPAHVHDHRTSAKPASQPQRHQRPSNGPSEERIARRADRAAGGCRPHERAHRSPRMCRASSSITARWHLARRGVFGREANEAHPHIARTGWHGLASRAFASTAWAACRCKARRTHLVSSAVRKAPPSARTLSTATATSRRTSASAAASCSFPRAACASASASSRARVPPTSCTTSTRAASASDRPSPIADRSAAMSWPRRDVSSSLRAAASERVASRARNI